MSSWARRRVTPASVTAALFLAYMALCAYFFFRACERGPASGPPVVASESDWLERLKQTGTDVQRDFAARTFRRGDPADRLLTAHPPTVVIRHPPYTTLYYWGRSDKPSDWERNVEVVTKDGKLARAKTSLQTGPHTYSEVFFFGDNSLLFSAEYLKTFSAGVDRYQIEMTHALMAVLGAAAGSW